MRSLLPALAVLPLVLAACADEGPEEGESAFQEAVEERHTNPQPFTEGGEGAALELGPDLGSLQLGPVVQVGAGAVTTAQLTAPAGAQGSTAGDGPGQIRTWVACPAGLATCNPNELSAGTVYTYIAEVTPNDWTSVFRTTQPVSGFTGDAGFDQTQAEAALPRDSELAVRCVNGALVWAINGGDGWRGEPVTLYWQSTSPPELSEEAFQLIQLGATLPAPGPIPTEGFDSACE